LSSLDPNPPRRPAPALDHVQLAAPPGCEQAARDFYGGLLGLQELDKPSALRARGGVWFALTGGQLHIGVQDPFAPATKAHPALRLPDPDGLIALAARLGRAGAPVAWDQAVSDVQRFFTADPWGNRLELLA
jgi:catechol 2,3-dioxygenase-like lactoylglutathione lyase family enzyme